MSIIITFRFLYVMLIIFQFLNPVILMFAPDKLL